MTREEREILATVGRLVVEWVDGFPGSAYADMADFFDVGPNSDVNLTPERVELLRKAVKAIDISEEPKPASPGPWKRGPIQANGGAIVMDPKNTDRSPVAVCSNYKDADAIVEAVNARHFG